MAGVLHANEGTFDEVVLQSKVPVLLDMYASWCGPCRVIGTVLERMAPKYLGRAKIVKVDIDKNPSLKRRYGVQSIPRLLVIKDGEKVEDILGAVPQAKLEAALDKHVSDEVLAGEISAEVTTARKSYLDTIVSLRKR
jgi:thioredoxin 1